MLCAGPGSIRGVLMRTLGRTRLSPEVGGMALARGRRDYSVFSKLSQFAKPNFDEAPQEVDVVNFEKPNIGIDSLLVRSDEDLGGFSTVHLDLMKENEHPYARFSGDLSLDLPEDRPEVVRLGYAMFRTKDLPPTLFGLGSPAFHDWKAYSQLSMRVRGDYRKYFINIQADTPYPTDLYQHRLFLKTPGEWETVTVSFAKFILTNGGVIQQQEPLDTSAIKSVGIGLIDGQYGPYQLDIDWIKVHNDVNEHQSEQVEPSLQDQLETGSTPIAASPMGHGLAEETEPPAAGTEASDGKAPDNKTPGKRLSVDD